MQDCKCAPVAFEPLSCHKAAVLTVIVKMPTGDDEFSPPDQCGIAIGSALVTLGRSQLLNILLCFCCHLCSIWPVVLECQKISVIDSIKSQKKIFITNLFFAISVLYSLYVVYIVLMVHFLSFVLLS